MPDKKSYRQLREKLDTILQQLESDNTEIDKALILHKKGEEILKQMEEYLQEVNQKIKSKK